MIFNHSFNYQIPKKNEIIIIMVLRTFSTSALKKEKMRLIAKDMDALVPLFLPQIEDKTSL